MLPIVGIGRALADVTRADCEALVSALDAKVKADKMAWKSATSIWGTWTKLLDDACNAKNNTLRVLADLPNPSEKVRPPDRDEDRQSTYLLPREATAVLGCAEIPKRWRVVYAIALYTGLRLSELAVLKVSDVVLDAGYVSVHKAHDRVSDRCVRSEDVIEVPSELLRRALAALDAGELAEARRAVCEAVRAGGHLLLFDHELEAVHDPRRTTA